MRQDRFTSYRGTVLGLAIGDALGAPVEFLSLAEIRERFGSDGIVDLSPWNDFPAGSFTDDTQMSVATAKGLLQAHARSSTLDTGIVRGAVHNQYVAWLRSQEDPKERRAPGRTCTSALRSGHAGSMTQPLNYSKGCGGVMRVAPIGLALRGERAFEVGAECAALTHGHPSGYLSAGFLAELIAHLADGTPLEEGVAVALETLCRWDRHEETRDALDNAIELARARRPVIGAMDELGRGFVGDEAVAIALFCALRFPDDWRAATIAAVNHSGDSDSTGSICGAIAGAALGAKAIPEGWLTVIEARPELERLARDLYHTFGAAAD